MPSLILSKRVAMIVGGVFSFMLDRKGFNFYKSYYDVAKELPEEDRNEFIWSIVSAEFTGELVEPKSKLARLMFLGQKHSILKQLDGYKAATKEPQGAPPMGPSKQVQVQEEEQEKDEEKGGFLVFGDHHEDKYILIVPKQINSTKYRINGPDGFKDFFDTHRSKVRNPGQVSSFLISNAGAHFEDFRHVYNAYNKYLEINVQAYGR